MKNSRRDFIKKAAAGSSLMALGGVGYGFSASSYSRIMGANDRIVMGIMGTNGRGRKMAANFALQDNTEVLYICDVEDKALKKGIDSVAKAVGKSPKSEKDIRKMLEVKDIDAVFLAPPDHWHVPATIMSCVAGKHVYVEKPLSHNPAEGEMAIKAARKYNKVVQMGAQRRSWEQLTEGMNQLHNGIIGNVYMAKTWYTNNRGPIGIGKKVPVPANLDFELWQGPAPRRDYKDNLVHYNWHWFWHWGTGEALNNGTHEVDLARWGLGLDFPSKVCSVGGRYRYEDDWETPDTQIITYEGANGSSVVWEGRSCNGSLVEGADRGVIFYGDNGTMRTGNDGYAIYDLDDKLIKEVKPKIVVDGRDTVSPSAALDFPHIQNFLDCVRNGGTPNADVETGHKSTTWVQLGNISQRVGRTLQIDQNGHIKDDPGAMKLWGREYESGWEPAF